jgi:CDP-diacylglycerol--serine O-phosphatidyltransferase
LKRLAIIPSLLTIGNAVCGFAAIIKIASIQFDAQGQMINPGNLHLAAWFILLAMVFDAFDGRVARMVKITSDFGGQLDSLADAISFGVAPAVAATMMNSTWTTNHFWAKCAWFFSLAFACGAILRLARFNVENDHAESAHMNFKGLPSPAAAGVIASAIIFQHYLRGERAQEIFFFLTPENLQVGADGLAYVLPPCALLLGLLMVSNVRYVHVPNRYLKGRHTFTYLAYLIFAALAMALIPEIALMLGFLIYALSGPVAALVRRPKAKARRQEEEGLKERHESFSKN